MVRVLYAAAIAYLVVTVAILLPSALRHPWQESIPELAPPFVFAGMLWFISVIYKSTRRPRATRRSLWFLGILALVGATSLITIDALARKADVRSVIWISGWLLVGVLSIAAARKTLLAPSDMREDGAQSPAPKASN